MSKTTIGRWVYIALPDLDLSNVKAKVDTGAYRSSLHCEFIEEFEEDGDTYLAIQTTNMDGSPIGDHPTTLKSKGEVKVKSSNGDIQNRPLVDLTVNIAGEEHTAEFTLTNRQDMKFPILLGRKFLRGFFIVDVSLDDPSEEEE
ncbi:MAG: RimK/LysX family protein [Candidatus Saccharimonadales bacterium]